MEKDAKPLEGTYRVLLVDDHPIVRDGLAQLIGRQADLTVCAEAANAADAMLAVDSSNPDVAVIDIFLEDVSGIELTKALHETHPELPILVLSMHDENLYAERALRAGALGYVMKQEASRTILKAIRTVLQGVRFLSDHMASTLLGHAIDSTGRSASDLVKVLSERELEVFELLGEGCDRTQLAEKLNISTRTVETHRANIKYKLNAKNATDLVEQAKEWIASEASENS